MIEKRMLQTRVGDVWVEFTGYWSAYVNNDIPGGQDRSVLSFRGCQFNYFNGHLWHSTNLPYPNDKNRSENRVHVQAGEWCFRGDWHIIGLQRRYPKDGLRGSDPTQFQFQHVRQAVVDAFEAWYLSDPEGFELARRAGELASCESQVHWAQGKLDKATEAQAEALAELEAATKLLRAAQDRVTLPDHGVRLACNNGATVEKLKALAAQKGEALVGKSFKTIARGKPCPTRGCSNSLQFEGDDACPWCMERREAL